VSSQTSKTSIKVIAVVLCLVSILCSVLLTGCDFIKPSAVKNMATAVHQLKEDTETDNEAATDAEDETNEKVELESQEAEAAASETASAASDSEQEDITVYITDNGKKYHREGCQYLSKSCKPISLSAAEKMNKKPCSRCFKDET